MGVLRRRTWVLCLVAWCGRCEEEAAVVADFELSNGLAWPGVGLGIGNLAHRLIPSVVAGGVDAFGYRLVDTAMASNNEHLLQETLRRLEKGGEVLVVTKVWYTHLGYGRTKIAVEESLRNLGSGTRVAMLLHWPRCRDDVEWMRCSEEEEDVELRYKRAGPAPHLDREDAWVGSWRALEEFYKRGRLAAISFAALFWGRFAFMFYWLF